MADPKLILVVEDNPDDELLMLDALQHGGVKTEIAVARDGQDAIDFLFGAGAHASRDAEDSPDLVLLDLKLPKIGGHEVLRRMRADSRTRHTPVVILTSSTEPSDIMQGYASGANSYVQKPVDFDDFVKAVKTLGVYWLDYNQVPAR
jgi:two-component system, response regulator